MNLCDTLNISKDGIIQSDEKVTTVKHRVIASAQHVLRIDNEDASPLSTIESDRL